MKPSHYDDLLEGVRLCLWTAVPTSVLFIPPVIYKHRDHGGMIYTGENSGFFHQRFLEIPSWELYNSKAGGTGRRKWWIRPYEVSFYLLRIYLLFVVKSYDTELTNLLPLRRKACYEFLSTLKFHLLGRVKPVKIGSNGKHSNHYTTEGD
jgi:hypothetical protein